MDYDFRPELWRQRLNRLGEQIRWLRRMPCPCVDPVSRKANRNCSRCDGSGYMHSEQTITGYRAIITGEQPQYTRTSVGAIQIGDVFCQTMPDEIPLARLDVVILPTRVEEDSVLIVAGEDVIPNHPVIELVAVELSSGAATVGTDCVLASDGQTVTWLQHAPTAGTAYSVRYRYSPTYDVAAMLAHQRKAVGGTKLPQSVVLRQRTVSSGKDAWH